jgi:hypothetical protein
LCGRCIVQPGGEDGRVYEPHPAKVAMTVGKRNMGLSIVPSNDSVVIPPRAIFLVLALALGTLAEIAAPLD